MTIQPGSRTDIRPPREAARAHGVTPFAPRKFMPPRFPSDLVGRDRRARWLDALAEREICLVRAPAGYGKTAFCATLFAEAEGIGWDAGWVSFDPEDNEPAAIAHVFEAVRIARHASAEDGIAGEPSAPASTPILADILAQRIDAADRPLLLVLDDVDRLTDARAIDVLNRLLRHPSQQLRLVLAGCAQPAVQIEAAERRDMVLHVGRTDLGLTDEEIHMFLQNAGTPVDAPGCAALNNVLEGWPAGLRLLMRAAPSPDLTDSRALTGRLDAYFAALLDELPPAAQLLLQRYGIAPSLSADLCRLLGGEKQPARLLEDLAARGVFVDAPRPGGTWYRLHPAFRAALQSRLDIAEPGQASQLHRVAARYYAAQGMTAEAIEQLLACGDSGEAATLIAGVAASMLERGDIATLSGWMGRLASAEVETTPGLPEAHAWLLTLTADRDANGAIAALESTGAAEAHALALFHRACVEDRPEAVIETCDRFLAAPGDASAFAVSMIRVMQAQGALKRGLFGLVHDAIRPLSLRSAGSPLDLPFALAICTRAGAARAQGQLGEAERVLREARSGAATPTLATALIDAALARCAYEGDEVGKAAGLAADALPHLARSCFQDALIQTLLVSIRAAAGLDQPDRAASLIDRAEVIAFERNWAPLKALCVIERARLRLPQTIDPEAVIAIADEDAAVCDPLSAPGRAFALLSEMRAYEAIALGDRPRLTLVAERLLRLASNADDAELRASATLFNILPQLSGRCDKMVALETVRFLNHAASTGFRRTIVDVLDVTGVRAVQNFCSEAYSSGSFLALLKLADPSRRDHRLEGHHATAPGEDFSFLTEREIDILGALKAGESNKEIARTLNLAPETVKWHLKNVMRKLRATSREEAVQNAATLGLRMAEQAG
ncbi:LuxR C-terminal-related transcriptional regulator [Sphingopyxis sp. J-6]|uniref:LuxR C-terminal-related transcriptional regulator n=1 Tax=Sphingopyxis sp. J-6 TaxID=3122054 RepID=UPI0039845E0F